MATQEELVKWGEHESKKGMSLNKLHSTFLKKGVSKRDSIKALKKIENTKKLKDYKKSVSESKSKNNTQTAEEKSSWFWPILIFLALIGLALYLYFSGTINFS